MSAITMMAGRWPIPNTTVMGMAQRSGGIFLREEEEPVIEWAISA
jgi:TPP-dependent indolepyruvate ferredoxin oxidoreductase alpha subunit